MAQDGPPGESCAGREGPAQCAPCEHCVFGRALPGGDQPAAPTSSTPWLATSSSPSFRALTGEWEACDLGTALDTSDDSVGLRWGFGQQRDF